MWKTENPNSKSSCKEIEDTGTVLKVENQNKIDRKLDDDSQVVEKVDDNDIPEVSEKEIDYKIKEKVSLDNIYALEAAGNDENNLLEDNEAKESEANSLNDPLLTQLDLNAGFVKETELEDHLSENEYEGVPVNSGAIKDLKMA